MHIQAFISVTNNMSIQIWSRMWYVICTSYYITAVLYIHVYYTYSQKSSTIFVYTGVLAFENHFFIFHTILFVYKFISVKSIFLYIATDVRSLLLTLNSNTLGFHIVCRYMQYTKCACYYFIVLWYIYIYSTYFPKKFVWYLWFPKLFF